MSPLLTRDGVLPRRCAAWAVLEERFCDRNQPISGLRSPIARAASNRFLQQQFTGTPGLQPGIVARLSPAHRVPAAQVRASARTPGAICFCLVCRCSLFHIEEEALAT